MKPHPNTESFAHLPAQGPELDCPLVTVITPVFNGEAFLDAALTSALGQDYPNYELIVIDDCSTNGSAAIVARHAGDPRVRVLAMPQNSGVAASRNRALEVARGQYICFHDQDDLWVANKLSLQVAAMREHPELGLLHARYIRIDEQGRSIDDHPGLSEADFGAQDAPVKVADVFEEIFISNDIQPLTSMIPKAVLDEVGHFEPDLPGVDDYELWLRIAYRYPVGHLQTIVGYWRTHARQQSQQGYRMLQVRLRAMNHFLQRHPDARQRVLADAFVARMGGMNRKMGEYFMYHHHDYGQAAAHFRSALALHPGDARSGSSWPTAACRRRSVMVCAQ